MTSSPPNKLFPGQMGFPTPNAAPVDTGCRVFSVPADEEWFALLMGACFMLTDEWRWFKNGSLTPAEASAAWLDILEAAYAQAELGTCAESVETPFWDDATDVDDDAETDVQPWYGMVNDPTLPAGSLTFTENILIWTFTGLLAVSGNVGAAILFHTTAQKFVIAQRAGSVGEVIRIVINAQDAARVDTTGHAGEIIETSVMATPSGSGYDVLIVKES